MRHTIFKTMVALLLTLATTACTDDMPVAGNPQGGDTSRPDATRITTLKNILPTSKPGYQGVDGRAYNNYSENWDNGDELLLKLEIKDGENVAYTAWMTLQCNGTNWGIKSTTTGTNDYAYFAKKTDGDIKTLAELPLVTPTTDIVLNGEGNFEAIIPEEIASPSLNVELMYAPDLEWTVTTGEDDAATTTGIALSLKENASTPTPEVWEVKAQSSSLVVADGTEATNENVWDTSLARVCVVTGTAGDVVTLTSANFAPYGEYKNDDDGTYTATTTGTDGIAYFYGTIGTEETPVTDDFQIALNEVMIGEEATAVFIPTTLFKANPLTSVSLNPAVSYKLDGKAARNQAAKDSQSADKSTVETYKVSGVKGLLEWLNALGTDEGKNANLTLEEDIVLPQYVLKKNNNNQYEYDTTSPLTYGVPVEHTNRQQNVDNDADDTTPGGQVLNSIKDADGNTISTGNWITPKKKINDTNFSKSVIEPYSGVIDGAGNSITGLRIFSSTDFSGFIPVLRGENAKIKDLTFHDAIVVSTNDITGVVAGVNQGGTISGCDVNYSVVYGAGSVGGVVGKNVSGGTVKNCDNNYTSVIGNSGWAGGIVGEESSTVTQTSDEGNFSVNEKERFEENGEYQGGTIVGCTNNGGKVEGRTPSGIGQTGGIIGHLDADGIVMGCINTGDVENTVPNGIENNYGYAGGIAGINKGTIVACGNSGTVTSITNVGGIVGYINTAGMVYGSWTKNTNEMSEGEAVSASDKDGFGGGTITSSGEGQNVFGCLVIASVYSVTDENINGLNAGMPSSSELNQYSWQATAGSWPTLSTSN